MLKVNIFFIIKISLLPPKMTECNHNSCSNACFSYSPFNYLSFGTKYYYVKSKTFRRRKKGKKYPALGGTAPLTSTAIIKWNYIVQSLRCFYLIENIFVYSIKETFFAKSFAFKNEMSPRLIIFQVLVATFSVISTVFSIKILQT